MSNATNKDGQPTGTLVERVIKNGKFKVKSRDLVPIETLKVGDYVSSYRFKDSVVYSREIIETSAEEYSGKIIVVNAGGNISKYTPKHKCLIRYRDRTNDYCVYVMRKGSAFRVGMSKMWHEDAGCGPYKRLLDEDGDELWILDTYPTRRDALLEETKVSIKFRLPQTMFKFKLGRGSWTQEEFDYVWKDVSNIEDAKNAIEHYNRNIDYPYFNRTKTQISIKRPHETYACNILKNSEMYVNGIKWVNIILSEENYNGNIYSIIVNTDFNHFADNILTSN